ncbi:MAG: T9SS type A sorting domain-containing protein [Bacteroidia bacterium]
MPNTYTLAPVSQSPLYQVVAGIRNNGLTTLTDVKIIAEYNSASDTISFDSLPSFTPAAAIFGSVNAVDAGPVNLTLTAAEMDTIANNTLAVGINDSTFARDDSVASGGLGFTGGTGIFGNMFELTQPDELTSISFFLQSSTIGDTMRILLYGFGNDVAGFPDTTAVMDSSEYFVITSRGWHNAEFTCQKMLPAGQYFVAAEQVGLNNLGFGYDLDNYTPGTAFFGDGINQWVEIGAVPSLVSSFLIRMNFGPATKNASISASSDQLCIGDSISLTSTGSGTFNWTGPGLSSTTGGTVVATPDATSTYSVSLVDANGCTSDASFTLNVNPLPSVSLDSTIAFFGIANGTATAVATGGTAPYSYAWSDSSGQDSSTAIGLTPGTYTVTVTDSFGCVIVDSIMVTEATSGIADLIDESLISIYPNPSDGNFTLGNLEALGIHTDLKINMTNLAGSQVYTRKVKGQNTLEISLPNNIPNGVYMLEVRSEERRVVKRIVLDK